MYLGNKQLIHLFLLRTKENMLPIQRPIGRMIYIYPPAARRRQSRQITPIGVCNIKTAATSVIYGYDSDAASVRRPRQRPAEVPYEPMVLVC